MDFSIDHCLGRYISCFDGFVKLNVLTFFEMANFKRVRGFFFYMRMPLLVQLLRIHCLQMRLIFLIA